MSELAAWLEETEDDVGGATYLDYIAGADLATAFREAAEQSEHEHGLDAVLVKKDTYIVINSAPLTMSEAEVLATKLIDNSDPRIIDKWGPLGVIAVRGGPRELWHLPVPAASGGYPDDEAASFAAVHEHLADGEIVTRCCLHGAKRVGTRIYPTAQTTASVTVAGSSAGTSSDGTAPEQEAAPTPPSVRHQISRERQARRKSGAVQLIKGATPQLL